MTVCKFSRQRCGIKSTFASHQFACFLGCFTCARSFKALIDNNFTDRWILFKEFSEAFSTNLLDKSYVATIGSNGFGNSGDNQTLLAGAPRQIFATVKVGF